jgi:hypothetical protein
MMPDAISVNTITLDRLKFAIQGAITNEAIHNMTVDVAADFMRDTLLVRLWRDVLAHKTVDASVPARFLQPATPWQHVKERWLRRGGRLARRFPVRYTIHAGGTVRFKEYMTFPENRMAYPPHLGAVVVYQQTDPTWMR